MTAHELARKLLSVPDRRIMILDGFNGDGAPREVNLGPSSRVITDSDEMTACDCEGLEGEEVIIIGYGCY